MCRGVLPDEVEALEHREPLGNAVPSGLLMAVREAVPRDGVCSYGSTWHPALLRVARCTGPATPGGNACSTWRRRNPANTSPRRMIGHTRIDPLGAASQGAVRPPWQQFSLAVSLHGHHRASWASTWGGGFEAIRVCISVV